MLHGCVFVMTCDPPWCTPIVCDCHDVNISTLKLLNAKTKVGQEIPMPVVAL